MTIAGRVVRSQNRPQLFFVTFHYPLADHRLNPAALADEIRALPLRAAWMYDEAVEELMKRLPYRFDAGLLIDSCSNGRTNACQLRRAVRTR
jgi:hypothetical protein